MKYLILLLFASIVAVLPNTLSAQTYTETTGEAGAIESNYGSVRGWRVLSGTVNGRFVYCVAEHPDPATPLRLGNSINQQWQLSIAQKIARIRKDWEGVVEVDGDTRYGSVSGSASGKWMVAFLGLDLLDKIKGGSNMIFGIGKYDFEFNLRGTTAAVLKVEECIQNRGRKPRKRATQRKAKPRIYNPVPRKPTRRVVENESYRMGAGCPRLGEITSPYSTQSANVEFVDQTFGQNGAVQVFWLDDQGNPVSSGIFDNGKLSLNSFVGHSFLVKDRDGTCYGGVFTIGSSNERFVVR